MSQVTDTQDIFYTAENPLLVLLAFHKKSAMKPHQNPHVNVVRISLQNPPSPTKRVKLLYATVFLQRVHELVNSHPLRLY
ncbi:hypothetical protein GDO78_010887 [Eleutherodactylus coqui]|uniref:Uncharacterized protein n=1 Tax=Eleutherodactylus coqui TaxID=57060 RepID=A0A8J6K5T4_ELECQ|nr:hypothetical protein GDO78_010887 [Eleutherodactylus coqui]